MLPIVFALMATVLLLVWMGFFMMGSLPLLILKHDTPLDSRFIRGLFNVYYLATMLTGSTAALCYAWSGRPAFAAGMAFVAGLAFSLRRWLIIPRMDLLRGTIPALDVSARRFRQLHIAGMALNVVQLGTVAWALTKLGL
ncbi:MULTISPECIES: hypothetical protein [unclassified Variovorax]|jgi:hypothetical protein|uniref:hypothetical protein n=1 Tax=unclassified Variovorax TaxID=663243 RepID=UPI000D13EB0C|nr:MULTISPECIES: hypothetical protein [unclassified Variovorax]AVQ79779.1 hypothetical protein C4F17_01775 [Variovorax sp. PMC12]QRY30885.1 hypothetical protein JVX96_22795 [Variovorax sp. PDNC026]